MALAPSFSRDVPAQRPGRRYDRQFVLLCLADGGEAMGIGMIFPLLARIQHAHHLPTYSLGIISGGAFIAALIGQVGVSHLLDGKWARPVLLAGLAAAVGALVWFALASTLWELAASRAINGVAYGVVGPAALRACTAGVSAEQRGARIGRLSSATMGGIVFGPLVGIGLAGIGGLRLPFLVLAGLLGAVLVALVLNTAPSPTRPPSRRSCRAKASRPGPRPSSKGPLATQRLLLVGRGGPRGGRWPRCCCSLPPPSSRRGSMTPCGPGCSPTGGPARFSSG